MGSRDSSHHLDLRGNGMTTDIVARAINRLEAMSAGESLSLQVDAAEAIDNDQDFGLLCMELVARIEDSHLS